MRQIKLCSVVGLVICASLFVGCKDKQKCTDALATARKATQDDFLDMALARQWRDYAGKICGAGPDLDALDKDIVAKEAAITKAAEDKAKADADAGTKAMDAAKKAWKAYDKLEDKEKTAEALTQTSKRANKVVIGLTPDYANQVIEYNKKQKEQRKKALEKTEK
ncbi:MAG TPA: hypothetical protein VHM70_09630 [Polyangiaceae bacterium]|jgi:hypothetical protein|nr:hypothetical protein [Polyangiaceae bacterium]